VAAPDAADPPAADPAAADPAAADPTPAARTPRRPTELIEVETPEGPGRWYVDRPPGEAVGTVALGHGAGGGVTSRDLEALAHRLPASGITVVRFEQPWRTAGGRVAVRPPRLDVAWRAAIDQLQGYAWFSGPLVTGGRSAGARVACRTAADTGSAAVVCLAFPLHLPGRPEKSRIDELAAPDVPRLVLQGTRDAFGTPAEIRSALPAAERPLVTVVELEGADHSFRVAAGAGVTAAAHLATVTAGVAGLVAALGARE
jgi:uncharacterized protein